MKPHSLISFLLLFIACGCSSNPQNTTSKNNQEISLSIADDPQVLDPRLIRDTISVNIAHMLFEGLMQRNHQGKLVPCLAESVDISEDSQTYIFHLRDAFWSDGSKIQASDFEYAWKSVLSPNFPAPNAYQLYVIKGAQEAKKGKIPSSGIGICALDNKTLQVTLEQPTPYFLELTATHFFSPIHQIWAEQNQNEAFTNPESIVTNGPFQLKQWNRNKDIVFVKNPNFWDNKKVKLEKITLIVADDNTALHMYNRNELDWVGSPMGTIPPDAIASLKSQKQLVFTPADGIHFLRVNTKKSPLNNINLRKALAYAIDRKSIVNYITQSNQQPAMGIVPLPFGLQNIPHFEDHHVTAAWTHFQQALIELNVSFDDLPPISLCYAQVEKNHKIAQALQQQWKESLGIHVSLESYEHAVFFDKLHQKNYDLSIGAWYGDIRDPINFLEIFKNKDNSTNNTQWENAEYIHLLNKSMKERTPHLRNLILNQAESLIMKQMPVIPIYYPTFNHLQKRIKDVYFSELGYLDFKYAYKE